MYLCDANAGCRLKCSIMGWCR